VSVTLLQPLAARPLQQRNRAPDLCKRHSGVVKAIAPAKPELAPSLQASRKSSALAGTADTTVLLAPGVVARVLLAAPTEDTLPTARDGQVKVVVAQVSASVGDLHHQLLACSAATGEGELVAGAAPVTLTQAAELGSSKAVGQGISHSPGLLVVACEGAASVAATGSAGVVEGCISSGAGLHWCGDWCLARPGAGGLAAVEVACGHSSAREAARQGGQVVATGDIGARLRKGRHDGDGLGLGLGLGLRCWDSRC
jgi:hypothetical protein